MKCQPNCTGDADVNAVISGEQRQKVRYVEFMSNVTRARYGSSQLWESCDLVDSLEPGLLYFKICGREDLGAVKRFRWFCYAF